MKKLYLLDASGYIYRSYFAIRNMTNAKGESTNALFGFIRSVLKLIKDFQPEYLVSVFDGPNNAKKRKAIYSEYKAHRSLMPEDLRHQIAWAHKFCDLMGIPQFNIPEAEADDVIGSIAKWASKCDCDVYMCTSDKDMAQIIDDRIYILNTFKDNQIINAAEAEKAYGVPPKQMIDLLAMMGDSSDNIPGLPGFGPKTAAELLKNFGSLDYILSHPEEVPGKKKQETIIQNIDKALLSRQLVTIDTSIHVPQDWENYLLKTPQRTLLKEFYGSLNFNSLQRELEQEEPSVPLLQIASGVYRMVDDEISFKELIQYLSAQKEICFETETTSLHPMCAELVGIGFCAEASKAWYVPANGNLGMEAVLEGLRPVFENEKIGFYGHNVKYRYHVLRNKGITIKNICFDTILASYLLNSHIRQHSLEQLIMEYFGKVKVDSNDLTGKGKKQISLAEVPIERVSSYCCENLDYICMLKQSLEKQLNERKLEKLFYTIELPLLKVLAEMERHGIFVDKEKLLVMSKEIASDIDSLRQQIFKSAGFEFNINSPMQLKEVLFEKMQIPYPKKRAADLSTSEEILEALKTGYPIAGLILEYRKLEKLRSTYIEALPQEINSHTGRIHCTFNQFVTATGRLSSQDPNLQNIPVRTNLGIKIREAFQPEKKDWRYLAADYSQIELRLMAHLSEDARLIEAFKNHEDIHVTTAAAIYHILPAEVTKAQRYSAKAINFGIMYGQQAFGLAQELGISNSEAAAFIETYFKRFHRVKEFLEHCKEQARKTGKAVTYTGRERLIPEINSKNGMLRAQAERLAINTPIQGSAADMIKMAMLNINSAIDKERLLSFMILQIHDELVFEAPQFELMPLETLVRNKMENVLKLKVPLIVDITIGKNWKEC